MVVESLDKDRTLRKYCSVYLQGIISINEPEPREVPSAKQVVGDDSAQSFTEEALRITASAGGYITFNCWDAPLVISIHGEIKTNSETVIDGGSGDIALDGGGISQILIAPSDGSLSDCN